jgi:UDPglucose 6-dehydrogenase
MKKIGVCGLGKLGFPIALSLAKRHDVVGYDVSPAAKEILTSRKYPHREIGAQELLETTALRIVDTVDELVTHSDVCFVIVQTPHRPEFEGVTRLPKERADFDYTYLREAVSDVAETAKKLAKQLIVVIMSTVLPGTIDREIKPLLNEYTSLVYNPAFPAMGTAVDDYESPEFVLIGADGL